MKLFNLLFILMVFPSLVFGSELKLFTTDGCSSFPDGTVKQQSLWINCCIKHDLAYWKGGSYDERLVADQALQLCVSEVGESDIANIMLAGVRVGGSPYFPTSYRWGYGWPYLRGYKPLTNEEKSQVKIKLDQFKNMINDLSVE